MHKRLDAGALGAAGAVVFLAFLAGALLMLSESFPYRYLHDAYRAGTALYAQAFVYRDPFATDLWNKARSDGKGVTRQVPELIAPGLTLYTSGDRPGALLIDMDGHTVHEWTRPYSTVWDEDSKVRKPMPDHHVYFRKAQVLPDGDLLALYEGVGDSPYGYGMIRISVDSELVWKNLDNLHHDFDLTPDGDIVTLAHGYRKTPLEGADQFEAPYMEDFLVIMGEDGRTETRLSLLDALNISEFRSYLWRIPYYSMEDPLHANAVDYLDAQKAAWLRERVPAAAEGQVLVSFRELAGGSIALVDVEQRKVVWASRGPWLAQHDPDIVEGGLIQVFDNRGNLGGAGRSRIIRVDPASGGIVWRYTGTADAPLDSPIRASQEPLPNGNTLITESSGGRLLEITRNGRIVWEYINPVRAGESGDLVPVVSWAQRVPLDYLQASFAHRLGPSALSPIADRLPSTRSGRSPDA